VLVFVVLSLSRVEWQRWRRFVAPWSVFRVVLVLSRIATHLNNSDYHYILCFPIDIAVNRNLFVRNRLSMHERAEHKKKKMFLFFANLGTASFLRDSHRRASRHYSSNLMCSIVVLRVVKFSQISNGARAIVVCFVLARRSRFLVFVCGAMARPRPPLHHYPAQLIVLFLSCLLLFEKSFLGNIVCVALGSCWDFLARNAEFARVHRQYVPLMFLVVSLHRNT
jgi:hypothetical protein